MDRFCYISYSCCCCYINCGITSNHTLVTTAIDITNDTDRIWYKLSVISLVSPETFRHIDVHLRITVHISLKATTEYIINTGSRLNINSNISWRNDFCSVSFCSRISGLITTTEQVLNNQRLCTIFSFFNIDSNITSDTTRTVITAKYIFKDTSCYRQIDVVCNMGIIRTTEDVFNFCIPRCTT